MQITLSESKYYYGFQANGVVVSSLIFGDCLVEKNEALDNEFPELENLILEKSG